MSKESDHPIEALTIDELVPQAQHQVSSHNQYPLQELIEINEGLKSRFEQLKEMSRH